MSTRLDLLILDEPLTLCRLGAGEDVPAWAARAGSPSQGAFTSITRTADELSILCSSRLVPGGVQSEPGWRAIQLVGPFDFSLIGIMLSVAEPLAKAGISILAISTFDTDYVLVKESNLDNAIQALSNAGHTLKFEAG